MFQVKDPFSLLDIVLVISGQFIDGDWWVIGPVTPPADNFCRNIMWDSEKKVEVLFVPGKPAFFITIRLLLLNPEIHGNYR